MITQSFEEEDLLYTDLFITKKEIEKLLKKIRKNKKLTNDDYFIIKKLMFQKGKIFILMLPVCVALLD